MDREERWAQFARLVAEGILDEDDRLFWQIVRPGRAALMLEVLAQRTSYITVALEAIYHGHNQAAVLRSADAFGIQHVSVAEGRNEFTPHRDITQGAQKWLTLHRHATIHEAIDDLRQRGYRIWASRLDTQAVLLDQIDLSHPAAFLFGNEHDGLSTDALHLADGTFRIPMAGFAQSLNISVAAAVTMFHVTQRARHEVGSRYPLSRAEQRSQLRAWLYNSAPNTQQLARVLDRPEIHPAQPHASRHSA